MLRILLGFYLLCLPLLSSAMDSAELIRHIDDLWRGKTSKANMTMTVKTNRYERTMTMDTWSRGNDFSLVVIREPIKDKDIATLKVKENIWNYLPKINRVTKVPSSMMSGSWMGSHFTNDDLVKDSSFEKDYDSHISFQGVRDGVAIYELSSIPKPDAPVVWGKVVNIIAQDKLVPLQTYYYGEPIQSVTADSQSAPDKDTDAVQFELVRTMNFSQIKQIESRWIPMRFHLVPEDKPGESTEIQYNDITFGIDLPKAFFSLQSLQRRR
jgi:outer membrane lipoprotein-sorting protein